MNTPAPAIDDLLVHGAWLRRLATHLVAVDSDAEDLVQETWVAALVRGPERREEARAWLARVMRNKAANRARSADARAQREAESAASESLPSTAVLAGRADLSRRLVELVLELPSDQKRLLLARYFEGLSSADIARRLNRPQGSVRSQLKRGLDQLRSRLDAENEGEREKWLAALTPLTTTPAAESAAAGTLLAMSAGAKIALGAGLLLLAALSIWWKQGPQALSASPPLVVSDRPDESPDPAAETTRLGAALATPEVVERLAEGSVLPASSAEEQTAAQKSTIRGQLLHPETGEAVIWFELGIVPETLAHHFEGQPARGEGLPDVAGIELVRTDEAGWFETKAEYESGAYALVPVEDWRVASPRMPQFRVRPPRAPLSLEHDPQESKPHAFELETGPVFVINCPKALELGVESMVAVYSYLDHFPPGYFRPSPMQNDPVPFVRMHTDFAASHRKRANNMRLVSADGFWSASIPMTIPDSIAKQHVRFDLEARALVEVDMNYGGRLAPPVLELLYWNGAVDPEAEDVRERDIRELQATFDGTDLEKAVVMYVPTGTATLAVLSQTSKPWYRVVELVPGLNSFDALLEPQEGATGRVEGRLIHVGTGKPEPAVRVGMSGELNGEPLWHSAELEFTEQGGQWIADFAFTHLLPTSYAIFFDKGGPQTNDPATFAVEPNSLWVEVDGPVVDFELHTDITKTRLRVKARDQSTGEKIDEFSISAFLPGVWLNSREKKAKSGRATMTLLGELEGAIVMIAAEGYLRCDLPLSQAVASAKGLELDVEMTPGWGGPVSAQDQESLEPLAGVTVLVDGLPVGETDEEGHFQLHVPKTPKRLDFELEGYETRSQYGWIDSEGEVLPYDDKPTNQYFQVYLAER